jgi:hypothetical protein
MQTSLFYAAEPVFTSDPQPPVAVASGIFDPNAQGCGDFLRNAPAKM